MGQRNLVTLSSAQKLGNEICKIARVKKIPLKELQFSDTETIVRLQESVKGKTVHLLAYLSPPVNERVIEFALVCNACKENGARKVIAILPYLAYSRQDRVTKPGEPISAKVMAKLLESTGCNKIITLDVHSPRVKKYFKGKLKNMEFFPVACKELKKLKRNWKEWIIIAPDEGAKELAKKYAKGLNTQWTWLEKHRPKPEMVTQLKLKGKVMGKNAFIVDDMINTASTMKPVVELLRKNGVKKTSVLITHGLFTEPAAQRLNVLKLKEIWTSNSLPQTENKKKIRKLKIINLAKLLANEVH